MKMNFLNCLFIQDAHDFGRFLRSRVNIIYKNDKKRNIIVNGHLQDNTSVPCITPYTPHLYKKTRVSRGIPIA